MPAARLPGCGHDLDGDDPEPIRHQVAELPEVRPEVIEYRLHRLTCPGCGRRHPGPLPAGVPRGAFGPRLLARVGLLSGAYRLSKRQVRALMADLLGLSISTGMIAKLQRQAGEALAGPMAEIVEAVRSAAAVHVDETGWREAGGEGLALGRGGRRRDRLPDPSLARGRRPAGPAGRGPGRDRVIISDRFPTYTRAPSRQLCWAHLRRDFQAMIDRALGRRGGRPEAAATSRDGSSPGGAGSARGRSPGTTLRAYVAGLRAVVGHLLREGRACACAVDGGGVPEAPGGRGAPVDLRRGRGGGAGQQRGGACLRHGVIWRKLSLGTASEAGSRFVERMLSVVETCRQRGRSVPAYLTACFVAKRGGRPIPSPLT